jgi:hypothetical protein
MKRLDFGDVLRIGKWGGRVQVLRISCLLQQLKFPPKFLGYLTGHRWGILTVLT